MFARHKNKPAPADEISFLASRATAAPAAEPVAVEEPAPKAAAPAPSGGFLLERNKPSVISEGFSLVGDISADGVLHVEGEVRGTVKTQVVNIGPNGSVDGEISCQQLHIKGCFVGQADCDELLIAGKARVNGRVTYRTLSVQRGADIDGSLVRVE